MPPQLKKKLSKLVFPYQLVVSGVAFTGDRADLHHVLAHPLVHVSVPDQRVAVTHYLNSTSFSTRIKHIRVDV